ncbi:hypothetical protein C8J55DRAFT_562036 [Lentinula edodes]|uniref:Uncharacterized protein n=1 Tax=Lentinula lateritia TaxID=40482 RepID=A0A9W9A722_9AGAR|nr:hypothetical protein C8J55DRAFT_562036 [Lentinula edodes]
MAPRRLQDYLENTISRVAKPVRTLTMKEFGEKYNSNHVVAVTAPQKEKLTAQTSGGCPGELDEIEKKRKWMAIQETAMTASYQGIPSYSSYVVYIGRKGYIHWARYRAARWTSCKRDRLRWIKYPDINSNSHPNPNSTQTQKVKPPFMTSNAHIPRAPLSPSKLPLPPKSSLAFNINLPAKTPSHPRTVHHTPSITYRPPRKDEQMLSLSDSPLANSFRMNIYSSGEILHSYPVSLLEQTPRAVSLPAHCPIRIHVNNSDAMLAEFTTGPYSGPPKSSSRHHTLRQNVYGNNPNKRRSCPRILFFTNVAESIGCSRGDDKAREEMGHLVEAAIDKWKIP